jgi:ribosomal protein L37AE/L43A
MLNKKLKTKPRKLPAAKNIPQALLKLFAEPAKPDEEGKLAVPVLSPIDKVSIRKKLKDPKVDRDVKAFLREVLKSHINLQEEVKRIETELKDKRKRLAQWVAEYGVSTLKHKEDKIVYLEPYKAHVVAKNDAGDINEQLIQAKFPELFGNSESIDLNQLDHAARKTGNQAVALHVQGLLAQIRALESVSGLKIIKCDAEGLMDMEKYEEYKKSGRITEEMVKRFETEGTVTTYLKAVEALGKDPHRCTVCGEVKPKRKVNGHDQACPRCGHEG